MLLNWEVESNKDNKESEEKVKYDYRRERVAAHHGAWRAVKKNQNIIHLEETNKGRNVRPHPV